MYEKSFSETYKNINFLKIYCCCKKDPCLYFLFGLIMSVVWSDTGRTKFTEAMAELGCNSF